MNAFNQGQQPIVSNGNDRDTLMLLSGVALVVFGTGLILSSPVARRFLGQVGLGDITAAAMPDVERYMKLRSM
jgi:hypothetical protein